MPSSQVLVAFSIIAMSFILIGYMLWIQDRATSEMRDQIKQIINSPKMPSNQTAAVISALEETEKSNQTTFNILLPVFAAWVTAVVAFYFHSKSQDNTNETINKLSSQITGKLSNMTIADLLEYYHDAKDVIKVKLTDKLDDVKEKLKKFSNVVVTDETGKPLGILYGSGLIDFGKENNTTILKDIITKINDHITNDTWTEKGVHNFAQITLQDTVSQAKQKMDNIKANDPKIRGLVLDGKKIEAIINYQMLTTSLK